MIQQAETGNPWRVELAQPIAEKTTLLLDGFNAQRSGDFPTAEARYRDALARNPQDGDALYLLGYLSHQQGKVGEALHYLLEAVAQRPLEPLFLKGFGDALLASGQPERAKECYRRALSLDRGFVDCILALGRLALAEKNLEEAVQYLRNAVEVDPKSAIAFLLLGCALRDLDNLEGAERCLRIGIGLDPRSSEAHAALGEVRMKQGLHAEAESSFRSSLTLNPSSPRMLNNIGSALKEQGKPGEAIPFYLEAFRLEPTDPSIPFNLGGSYSALGNVKEAIHWYDCATLLKSDYAEAHANKSLLLLGSGEFERGWKEYEWRFKLKDPRQKIDARTFPVPEWKGESFQGRTLLVRSEQGAGDMIQFSRYLPLVKARGGRVILECGKRISRLLKDIDGVDQVITIAQTARTGYDLVIPLLSVPQFFTHSIETIPYVSPYLSAEQSLLASARARVANDKMSVGLCWQGNKDYVGDQGRSIPLRMLEPLFKVPGVQFYSLQKGFGSDQISDVPEAAGIVDLGSRLDNGDDGFIETAAVLMHLDLVISTDTAIPHLAGALGQPVWLLLSANPEWRWFTGVDTTPWYPSMRLYRQHSFARWDDVVERVVRDLREISQMRQFAE